jgi:uncharacterized protein
VADPGPAAGQQVVDGRIVVRMGGRSVGEWTLSVRIPRWAADAVAVTVNGAPVPDARSGYVRLTRDFQPGDVLELTLPMAPRFTAADPRVDAVRGCLAVERGPEVLCLESVDTPAGVHVDLVRLDRSVPPREKDGAVMVSLRTTQPNPESVRPYAEPAADVEQETGSPSEVRLGPHHSWGNRGPTTMRVWLPTGS